MAAPSTLIFLGFLLVTPLISSILQAPGLRWFLHLLQPLVLQLQFLQPKLKWINAKLIINNNGHSQNFEFPISFSQPIRIISLLFCLQKIQEKTLVVTKKSQYGKKSTFNDRILLTKLKIIVNILAVILTNII